MKVEIATESHVTITTERQEAKGRFYSEVG